MVCIDDFAIKKSKSYGTIMVTGLKNVRQFEIELNRIISRVNETITMLFIDIDFFKKVNDTYGHQNGDIVL